MLTCTCSGTLASEVSFCLTSRNHGSSQKGLFRTSSHAADAHTDIQQAANRKNKVLQHEICCRQLVHNQETRAVLLIVRNAREKETVERGSLAPLSSAGSFNS